MNQYNDLRAYLQRTTTHSVSLKAFPTALGAVSVCCSSESETKSRLQECTPHQHSAVRCCSSEASFHTSPLLYSPVVACFTPLCLVACTARGDARPGCSSYGNPSLVLRAVLSHMSVEAITKPRCSLLVRDYDRCPSAFYRRVAVVYYFIFTHM